MPYMVVSLAQGSGTAFRGPCTVGDADAHIELMAKLGASFDKKRATFESAYPIRLILDILERVLLPPAPPPPPPLP